MDLGHRFATLITLTFGVCSFQVILFMSLAAVRVFWRIRVDWQLQPASKSHGRESDTTTWWNAESLCMFFLSLTWKIWWELDRDVADMGGLEVEMVEFLKWRSAPWSRLTTYFDNPQSREAGGIDGIDGIDMNLKWIDIYWNMNWHDMKSRKAASQVFCANAGDSRCVLARHCAQWVGWRMLEAAHRQQMGVYCWLCLYSFFRETHVSYSFGEVTKVDYTVIIQHWCIDGAAALIYLTYSGKFPSRLQGWACQEHVARPQARAEEWEKSHLQGHLVRRFCCL